MTSPAFPTSRSRSTAERRRPELAALLTGSAMTTASERRFRFAFVTTMRGSPWGGSEHLWSETAEHLRAAGHRVAASVLRWPEHPAPVTELIGKGVDVAFRAQRGDFTRRFLGRVLPSLRNRELGFTERRWLRRTAPDLVLISQGGPWDGIPWMLTCRELRIPYCAVVHANSPLWWPPDDRLDAIRAAVAGAERIFFVSRANHRLMELQCGMRFPHAEVIANPCKIDRRTEVSWPVADGTTRLACVGRLSPTAKGQDLLLQVLAQPQWRTRPVELNFYGTGPAERSLRALADFLGLANVHFRGHVSDVRRIWETNHALVLPSRYEGLPLTIFEAMICGRPVVTTAVAGNTEIVEDHANGFVAPAAMVPLLAEAMERAWSRRDEWPAIGARGRGDALRAMPEDPIGLFMEKLLRLAAQARSHVDPSFARLDFARTSRPSIE